MSIRINCKCCDGCRQAKEPACVRVCPGGLLYKDKTEKAAIREPKDCWDCAACVKECPQEAIEMFLPVEAGGRGSTLTAHKQPDGVRWTLTNPKGKTKTFITASQKVI